MSLKKDIVLVNEYTAPLPGGGGTRGSTPGKYVTRYMARNLATETLAPIRRTKISNFIERYMAREEAVEDPSIQNRRQLKHSMAQAQGNGGVAFGYGEISLSDDQLKAASNDVQKLFDEGHTVMKTVLSFNHKYLVKHGLVPKGLKIDKRGDYRGYLDQMKLRMAITAGVERMGRRFYDELRWVGVIQVDTKNVHCHLAMVDAGKGTITRDGTQRGKLPRKAIAQIRRSADAWLDEHQTMKHLSSAVGYERRNVITYVKRWAHQKALDESLPQFLLATLPEDCRLWRYDTNNKSMRRSNKIVVEIVEEVLDRPDSPMKYAMVAVQEYANERRRNEDLSDAEWADLIDVGRVRIIERAVNSVYAMLRQLPADALVVKTPILDVMGMDFKELAAKASESKDDDLVGFSYRMRSYSARLEEHSKKREEARENVRSWEIANESGVTSGASIAMYHWYKLEEEYHAKCMAKYRYFLPPISLKNEWVKELNSITDYGKRLVSLESMRNDVSLKRMKDLDEAERVGYEVYGQYGGRLVCINDAESKARLQSRIDKMRKNREERIEDLKLELSREGYILNGSKEGEDAEVEIGTEYDFEEVKSLDLHHLKFDFASDAAIGLKARDHFVNMAKLRVDTLAKAVEYLDGTDQAVLVDTLPTTDVFAMAELANELAKQERPVLVSEIARVAREKAEARRSKTVRLGTQVDDAVVRSVDRAVIGSVRELPNLYLDDVEAPDKREGLV